MHRSTGPSVPRHSSGALFLSALLAAVLLSACVPLVTFQQLQPGRYDIGKDAVIALGNVDIVPEVDVIPPKYGTSKTIDVTEGSYFRTDAVLAQLQADIEREIAKNPFIRYSKEDATYYLDLSGKFKAKDKVQTLKDERKADPNRPDAGVYYEVQRNFHLDLNYQLMALSGNQLGRGTQTLDETDIRTGNTREDAATACKDWADKSREMTQRALAAIMKEIVPHYERMTVKLKKGSSRPLNEGVARAVDGRLEDAGRIWLGLLPQVEALPREDRAALYNDLGVYFETQDRLEEAAQAFASCIQNGGDKVCTDGLNRARARDFQLKKLKKSGF